MAALPCPLCWVVCPPSLSRALGLYALSRCPCGSQQALCVRVGVLLVASALLGFRKELNMVWYGWEMAFYTTVSLSA